MGTGARIMVGLLVVGALAFLSQRLRPTLETSLSETVDHYELEVPLKRVGEVERSLSDMAAQEKQPSMPLDKEIDFNQPTSDDILFLLEVLRTGDEAQARSAATALAEIHDPRHALILFKYSTGAADPMFFCLAGLEILRFQTSIGAGEFIARALAEPEGKVAPECRTELNARLESLLETDVELQISLLKSAKLAIIGQTLEKIPADTSVEVANLIEGLARSDDKKIATLAKKRLDHLIPKAD